MMNEILKNLVNTVKVARFICNIIVGTKEKEGHNKIEEEEILK